MQADFHYYATVCAAFLAGYSQVESIAIGWSSAFVDHCSAALLGKLHAPQAAATTQLQAELAGTAINPVRLQNMTRIWASFHFLPYDLYAEHPKRSRKYMNRYRMICRPNGRLIVDTVELARHSGSLQAAGIAMHVLADTWAHSYFAGTPSLIMNNTNSWFYEMREENGTETRRKICFRHTPGMKDEPEKGLYCSSLYQTSETSVMNLGHARAGHLPDYSFLRYTYLPAWGDYEAVIKDNPEDYLHAFGQMVYALEYLRGKRTEFIPDCYAEKTTEPWRNEITAILKKRKIDTSQEWKELTETILGCTTDPFSADLHQEEYREADRERKNDTFLGQFFLGAMSQKSMVTNKIFRSGNPIAGFSVDYRLSGFKGIRDYRQLIREERGERHESR